jgi:hypothetical protein
MKDAMFSHLKDGLLHFEKKDGSKVSMSLEEFRKQSTFEVKSSEPIGGDEFLGILEIIFKNNKPEDLQKALDKMEKT